MSEENMIVDEANTSSSFDPSACHDTTPPHVIVSSLSNNAKHHTSIPQVTTCLFPRNTSMRQSESLAESTHIVDGLS